MWRYEFDESGGYDCMSAAYLIFDKYNEQRLTVDTKDFAGFDGTSITTSWQPLPEAEEMAKFIVEKLNLRDNP